MDKEWEHFKQEIKLWLDSETETRFLYYLSTTKFENPSNQFVADTFLKILANQA